MDSRRDVVLVAPNWLGDAIMSLPAVGGLLALADGGVRLSVLASPYAARVYAGAHAGARGLDGLTVDSAGSRWRRLRERAAILRSARPDAAVILPPSFSSALGPALARVPERVGLAADGRSMLLTDAVPDPGRGVHVADTYRLLARRASELLGLGWDDAAPPARPVVGEPDRESARALLDHLGVTGPYVVMVPGAAFGPAKSWPAERFREAAAALAADLAVVVAGGPGERHRNASVCAGLAGVHDATGVTTLGSLFALIEGSRAVVANDSGAAHVAGALEVPSVVLFGSTSPDWTGPRDPRATVVRHPVHCAPCFRRTCPYALECFTGIAVDEVVDRARAALAGAVGAKKGVAESGHRR